ncbi:SDR family NAD(P)-dependent oxidoreductase [Brevibacillus agri]|uniref:SDR family NAD(P)-dependent oxidoreductase n=1 Tax=Brevibacillus agri TaxID=51101 RepID=UPI002E1CEE23|nr:SDR family NAD(P)-dependent oxidoreductase [Brevibacillus agri]MED1657067.1 SDR family NAD(P)-dependent oxidoreductase [Brevibacillus agri]MED1686749.1 SDR family NAD(P)-dependent oxidoreductase [Brevibacillus agri]MED1693520.1 SDR family NAD(P)-dependent oxidoreductase [Brevibacillus agri]MED1699267.1 SDR family NAD(P)-dependent oxidoreductase [Brevibacillus agri]
MNENAKTGLEVAIIGMSGAFPGAKNLEQFFHNVKNGVESISFFSEKELEEAGVAAEAYKAKNFVNAKGHLEESDYFDNNFFGYTPNETQYMDPQTRLLHEHTWKALEDAGYPPGTTDDAVGVYVGGRPHFRWEALSMSVGAHNGAEEFEIAHLNDKDLMSTRVSYKLHLTGPSYTLFTACSTSLVAVHVACQGVLSGECDLAVAGGVSVTSPLKNGYVYQDGMILSSDGHCRAFDAESSGTVVGNGIGLVILKRLDDALRDRDHIYAVIKGSAINNDGNRKVGYTAPSVDGQVEVIRAAHRVARVDPATIGYVEAHGTGTALGDPIEVKALTRAFQTGRKNYCGLGSVKTNIGHLDSAAGIAGLIKTVLALDNKCLPPTLHVSRPNQNLELENTPFFLVDQATAWVRPEGPLRAGVSSFGVGGTNAHVVLEEAPASGSSRSRTQESRLLVFSAKSEAELERATDDFVAFVKQHPGADLADIAYTLQMGRAPFSYRRYVACSAMADACAALAQNRPQAFGLAKKAVPPIAFVFSELGAEEAALLYRAGLQSAYCRDEFAALLQQASEAVGTAGAQLLDAFSARGQIMSFLFQLAAAKWLQRIGVQPAAVAGAGSGEYVAACLAGVFSVEEALTLVEKRGELLEELSGSEGDLFLLEALQAELFDAFRSVQLSLPSVPVVSCAAGKTVSREVTIPDYWVNRLGQGEAESETLGAWQEAADRMEQLRFGRAKKAAGDVRTAAEADSASGVLSLVAGPADIEQRLLEAIGHFWSKGCPIKWAELNKHLSQARVSLPTYPFTRKNYGVDAEQLKQLTHLLQGQARVQVHPQADGATVKQNSADWLYIPSWTRSDGGEAARELAPCLVLVFATQDAAVIRWIAQIEAAGHAVVRVEAGEGFAQKEAAYTVNPDDRDDLVKLLETLALPADKPLKIVHFWCYGQQADATSPKRAAQQWNRLGYHTLLNLARAIGQLRLQQTIAVDIVTSDVFEVIGDEAVEPAKATLLGPVRVIPKEYENMTCRLIDADRRESERVGRLLLQQSDGGEDFADLLAVRHAYIWEPAFKQVHLPASASTASQRLKHGGVYVITGGLGAIGLHVAKFLAEKYHATLVLINRSHFLPEAEWDLWRTLHGEDDPLSQKIALLRELQASAKQLCLHQANIADEAQVLRIFSQIVEEHASIDGVIHLAGVPDGAVIQRRTSELDEAVFATKVYGTVALQKAIEQWAPSIDFLLLFSSLSSVIAPPAQVAYSAANAFLDAFALTNTRQGVFTQAINWDAWENTGMASLSSAFRPDISALPGISYRPSEHPFFRYVVQENKGRTTFLSHFQASRDWILAEHRVGDRAVLPGTCYVEMACAAYEALHPELATDLRLHDVFFLAPLLVADDAAVHVRTVLLPDDKGYRFTVESRTDAANGNWTIHACGYVGAGQSETRDYQLAAIRAGCAQSEYGPSDYNSLRDSQFTYGPRWNSYRRGTFTAQQGLSQIELPAEFADDTATYRFHPAIIDVALVYMNRAETAGGPYVPFAYKSIAIHGSVPENVYSHIRLRTAASPDSKIVEFDLTIMDEQGRGIVEIEGYQVAAVSAQQPDRDSAGIEQPQLQAKTASLQAEDEAALATPAPSLTVEEGLRLLDTALAASYSQLLVSTVDLPARLLAYKRQRVSALAESGGQSADEPQNASKPSLSLAEAEKLIADIWQAILGHERIARDDDFFELGGDSLKVLTVAERLYQASSIKIPIAVFFQSTTVENLARYMADTHDDEQAYTAIPKAAPQAYYPLSSAQKRLYFQQQVQPDNVAYNIPEITYMEGDFDLDRLQAAFRQVIRRHAILRTGFDVIEGEMVQRIADEVDFQVEYRELAEADVQQTVRQFMQPFDLRQPPLMRVKVVRYAAQKYVWLFDIHHIVADNISVAILQNELIHFYNDEPEALDPVTLEYVDFVAWQNERIQRGDYDKQTAYWLMQLSGKLPEVLLPTDFPRPSVLSYRGDIYPFHLEKETTAKLKEAMKRSTTTLFMNMLAIFHVLLHKYTGQEEVVIGASLAGRNHADLAKMVGMFANVLPFYSRLAPDVAFGDYVSEVKANSLQLFENQDVQFEILVEQLGLTHQLSAHPLFTVMLVLPDFKPAEVTMKGLTLKSYPFRNPSAKFDLTLWVYDYDSSIELRMEYSTDLFTRKTIQTMSEHFLAIAKQVADNPDVRVKDIVLDTGLAKAAAVALLDDGDDFAF